MADLQVVVFTLNNEVCGVDTSQVFKIVKYQDVTKIHDLPEFIEGLINLRGRVVPIVNLNKRFALGVTEITKKTKIIITQVNNDLIGFTVNDVSEILRLSGDDVEATPEIIHRAGNSYLRNVGKKGEKLISVLDFSNILNDEELSKVDNKKLEEDLEAKKAQVS